MTKESHLNSNLVKLGKTHLLKVTPNTPKILVIFFDPDGSFRNFQVDILCTFMNLVRKGCKNKIFAEIFVNSLGEERPSSHFFGLVDKFYGTGVKSILYFSQVHRSP